MFLLDDLLLSPVKGVLWVFREIHDAAQQELAGELRRAVALLPPKHRDVLLLRFFEEASLRDMASVLGCSVGTVKSRLHHALDKLRKMNLNLAEVSWDTWI